MIELFITLINYLWIGDFVTLAIFVALAVKKQQNTSSLMTQTLIIIMSGIIIKYQALVNEFISPDGSQGLLISWCIGFILFDVIVAFVLFKSYGWLKNRYTLIISRLFALLTVILICTVIAIQFGSLFFGLDGPSYKIWILFAFDLGVVMLDGLVIYAIWQVHVVSNIPYSLIARMYLLAFFVAASIHMFTFIELITWQSNYMAGVYYWGSASINVSTTVVAMLVGCVGLWQYFNKKSSEGTLWTL